MKRRIPFRLRRPVAGALGRRAGAALALTSLALPLTVAMSSPAQAASSGCYGLRGPYQRQAERFLGLKVDGRQSPSDCRAIRAFQTSHGITPNYGYAGPVTWNVMQLVARQRTAGHNPNSAHKCPTDKGRIACVDLTRQLSWIQDGKRLVYGPVPVRTGRKGGETRTGLKRIYWRHLHHVSTIYHTPMPYSQFFDGGEAFHAISGSVWSAPGSHGCVNMRPNDAKKYWSLPHNGDDVYVYGHKPGT
ncbi:L,D-transpeptidase family protein [Streptomyces noursei]|uniref:L,D-transpeptidase family protein n=1 Tax=Streptomyces noursei TaxID=1971 RepID=UPI0019CD04D1|nr:L,D-transpeptidase family protein [Streptomyces noursei]MCZ1020429.1 L,D-transpeptidase family protein [Streptomyces noursei]GGX13902.1 murein L,D-transpeptidase [Streptomyces noursei]